MYTSHAHEPASNGMQTHAVLQVGLLRQCLTDAAGCTGCFGGNVRPIPGRQVWTGVRALHSSPDRLDNRRWPSASYH